MIKELFSSKKFIVLLVSLVVYVASRLGLEVSAKDLEPLVAMVGTWLVGQGIADAGKNRKLPDGQLVMTEVKESPEK